MNKLLFIVSLLMLGGAARADAATTTGPGALALAALVAGHSPALASAQKREMERLLEGDLRGITSQTGSIPVKADSVVCRSSDVDITARSCTLYFGPKNAAFSGRRANELFATMWEAGVPPQGGAGSFYVSLKHLSCAIDPKIIRQKAGGGAKCTYQP